MGSLDLQVRVPVRAITHGGSYLGRVAPTRTWRSRLPINVRLQHHRLAGADRFVAGKGDAQAIDGVLHVVGQVDVVADGA